MPDVLSITKPALQADQFRLDSIGRNVANSTTSGYKRSVTSAIIFDSFLDATAGSSGGAPAVVNSSASSVSLFVPTLQSAVDSTQAGLLLTNRSLDLAIDGAGFFAVSDGKGLALTRAGAFSVDQSGWLVNARGARVQGQGGDVHVGVGKIALVDGRGRITTDGQLIDTLKLLTVSVGARLTSRDGLSLVSNTGEYVDADWSKATVRSGFLEASNSTGVRESVGMVETMRHYESLIRLYQGYDDILGKTIQKLGDL